MNKLLSYIIFLIVSLHGIFVYGQEEWKLRKEKDGISAYTSKQPNTRFDKYKVEASIEGNINSFYSLFKDFDVYQDIFDDVIEVRVYENSPKHHVVYIHTRTPFPAKDRDSVMEGVFSLDKTNTILRLDLTCIDEYYQPNKKRVQIKSCIGYWEVKDEGENRIRIIHEFSLDPGGKIPAFIVNLKTVQSPVKAIKAIKKLIKLPQYQGQILSFK